MPDPYSVQASQAPWHIATSGWHYSHWRGNFYPLELAPADWLAFYAQTFSSVEVNNTFYRLPSVQTVQSWAQQTPPDFIFAVKASRLLTHMKKLRDCAKALARFLSVVEYFGGKLGPILFQLPPNWQIDCPRLESFLKVLPVEHRYAFEFRHASWHCQQVYELLSQHDIAFCQYELAGYVTDDIVTTDFAYVRLHGPNGAYGGNYSDTALRRWAARLHAWQPRLTTSYLYFDNDEAGYAVKNARRLLHLCQGS